MRNCDDYKVEVWVIIGVWTRVVLGVYDARLSHACQCIACQVTSAVWDTLEPLKDRLQELRLTRLCPECGEAPVPYRNSRLSLLGRNASPSSCKP